MKVFSECFHPGLFISLFSRLGCLGKYEVQGNGIRKMNREAGFHGLKERRKLTLKYEKDGLMGKGLHLLYVHLKIRTGTSQGYFLG